MKRILPLFLALALILTACGGSKEQASTKTPDELKTAYTQAITDARDEELNQAFPVRTDVSEMDEFETEMVFGMLGFAPEDAQAYGISMTFMNVSAYAIAAVMPAEGKEDTVRKGLEAYREAQKQNFQFYLEDQFDIASNAKLEKLNDGTLLMVMCENQDTVFDSIKASLEK